SVKTEKQPNAPKASLSLSQEAHRLTLSAIDDRINSITSRLNEIKNQKILIQSAQSQLQQGAPGQDLSAGSNVSIPNINASAAFNRTPAIATTPQLTPLSNTPWPDRLNRDLTQRKKLLTAKNVRDDRRTADQNLQADLKDEAKNDLEA